MSVSKSIAWRLSLSVLLAGCGGIDGNGLLDTGDAAPDAAASSSGDATVAATSDAGVTIQTANDASTLSEGGGGLGGDVDAGVGDGSTSDAGGFDASHGRDAASAAGDAEAGPPLPDGVRCGYTAQGIAAYCPAPTVCCVTGNASGYYFGCVSGASQCPGLTVPCDEKTDCPAGNLCCGIVNAAGQYTAVQCQTSCDVNQGQHEMCNPYAATNECAASGMTCQASTVLPGYYRCSP